MRSVDVLFDPEAETRIRAQWAALGAAGIPSLALHRSESNRPHLTLLAGRDLTPPPPGALGPLPTSVDLSSLVLFPHGGRFVLAWGVVRSPDLDALHARAIRLVPGAVFTSLPEAWTPHVTIARRLRAEHLGEAAALLGEPFRAGLAGALFWDGDVKTVTGL
ncbi:MULTISPECIES: 2'-5' RNA ligase family protein [unclassified Rathayibacter]|uniref:2'-5' RNA ligase family protein n=1 Tax=unclassified Rathayibacter TaxID=2609250 RepID=UPI00188D4140|nr:MULTISPECIES: 2'-5' RNA ligase family protein [unclassified Rathayibacter]MBF4463117.1 2'-5' RNA ligase family protein [Rathayibacter sp. VKM Ac-2879]MBF4504646.1 2'-5' RNA ligase family protein [Rathayibacter sp. VKM Ac-2878]